MVFNSQSSNFHKCQLSAEGMIGDQWLRLCAPNTGVPGLVPGQGTRSHMPQLRVPTLRLKIAHATIKDPRCCTATKTQHSQTSKYCKTL